MDESELEQLIRTSGVGPRTASKLREARRSLGGESNDDKSSASKAATRGHGAPSANRTPVATL